MAKNARKAISPLIAAVLLIAFTMAVSVLVSPWLTDILNNLQEPTGEKALDVQRASDLGLDIVASSYNRSTDNLSVSVMNTGERIDQRTNLSIGLAGKKIAKNQVFNVNIGPNGIRQLEIPVEKTYGIENLKVSMTDYPVSSETAIVCTPTKDLQAYWSFNQEQTQNGWTLDLSGNQNNGTINGGLETDSGIVGESYRFNASQDTPISVPDDSSLENYTEFTAVMWTYSRQDEQSDYAWLLEKGAFDGAPYFMTDESSGSGFWRVGNGTEWDAAIIDIYYREWNMLAQTWNGTNQRGYTNAEETTSDIIVLDSLASNSQELKIASRGSARYKGKIDEIRLYNRSLSQAEIERLYNVRSSSWAINSCKLTS